MSICIFAAITFTRFFSFVHSRGYTGLINRKNENRYNGKCAMPELRDILGKKYNLPLSARLIRGGWKYLANGNFSQVYTNSRHPEIVIKYGFDSLDVWPQYAIWAAEHGFAGLNAPRVYAIKRYPNQRLLSVVERLQPVDVYHNYGSDDWWKLFNPDFSAACKAAGWVSDIKQSNILMRANGTYVLNDPQLGGLEYEAERAQKRRLSNVLGSWKPSMLISPERMKEWRNAA